MDAADTLKRLRWRCRRGMRELDLVLVGYLDAHANSMTADDLLLFERFLEATDMQLYSWLTGRETPHDPAFAGLVAALRATADAT